MINDHFLQDISQIAILLYLNIIDSIINFFLINNTFAFAVSGRNAVGKLQDGSHVLKGVAEYGNGERLSAEIPVVLDSNYNDTTPPADIRAAITFAGAGAVGKKLMLAKDGKRGDMKLELRSTDGLKAGDCILIDGPATERWKKLTKNACKWGTYRFYEVVITGIKDNTVAINQPLRIEFPVIDGSYVQKVKPIRRCGSRASTSASAPYATRSRCRTHS